MKFTPSLASLLLTAHSAFAIVDLAFFNDTRCAQHNIGDLYGIESTTSCISVGYRLVQAPYQFGSIFATIPPGANSTISYFNDDACQDLISSFGVDSCQALTYVRSYSIAYHGDEA